MPDDLGRELMASVGDWLHGPCPTPRCCMPSPLPVTMPLPRIEPLTVFVHEAGEGRQLTERSVLGRRLMGLQASTGSSTKILKVHSAPHFHS